MSAFDKLRQETGLTQEQILEIIRSREEIVRVPVSIFATDLAPLEALVLYLKDEREMNFASIARILNRDDRTIWFTYSNAVKKGISPDIRAGHEVPLRIFSDRDFSILESLAWYMQAELGLKLTEIGAILGKDPKTIWTVINRHKKKLSASIKGKRIKGKDIDPDPDDFRPGKQSQRDVTERPNGGELL